MIKSSSDMSGTQLDVDVTLTTSRTQIYLSMFSDVYRQDCHKMSFMEGKNFLLGHMLSL